MKSVEEWEQAFDLLWNNIASDKAPGLEAYEKSVFLTQAQNALVKDYFSANSNTWKQGFDDSTRRQSDFRSLITSKELDEAEDIDDEIMFRSRTTGTKYYKYPTDCLFMLNEELTVTKGEKEKYFTIVPVAYDEYARLMMRPYKYPPKGQAWRLITNSDLSVGGSDETEETHIIELIGNFPNDATLDYRARYITRPSPIILTDLTDSGLSIEGATEPAPCKLPEHLHDEILQRAVLIAKIAWIDTVAPAQNGQI